MTTESDQQKGSDEEAAWLGRLPVAVGVIIALLLFTYAWTFSKLPVDENPAAWGAFGDYMGGLLNPLISLFTLMVAVQVWRMQKTELLETRKAVEEQGKTAEQQRREQRFFDLLNLYKSTVESISVEQVSGNGQVRTFSGKRAFSSLTSNRLSRKLTPLFEPRGSWGAFLEPAMHHEIAEIWSQESSFLDHYFRVIFTLLREAEPLLQNDRFRYIKMLRAQLSRDEINLLALNLIFDEEGKRMRGLVATYGFLKHLQKSDLRDIAERELLPLSFGRQWSTNNTLKPIKDFHAP